LNLSDQELLIGNALIRDAKEKWMARQYGNFVEFIQQSLGAGDSPGRRSFEIEMRENFSGKSYWNGVLEGSRERRLEADLHGQWYPRQTIS
jgi:hypothetical protein